MDGRTEELRDAHDVLSEWYAKNLAGVLERMPVERAMARPVRRGDSG